MATAFALGYILGAPCGVWLFVKYEAWQYRREQRRLALERAQAAYDREQAQHFWRTSPDADVERRAVIAFTGVDIDAAHSRKA